MRTPFSRYLVLVVIIFISLPTTLLFATHIVGGEFTYACIGSNKYHFKLSVYRDCINGSVSAIRDDNPALISIFTQTGVRLVDRTVVANVRNGVVVPADFSNLCVRNPPLTCLNRIDFEFDEQLDESPIGYTILYQNSARNQSISNLIDPGMTGATYMCKIPPSNIVSCNSSAQFKYFPPQIICVNNPFVYDHGATDIDGDSLSYSFCPSYNSYYVKGEKFFPVYFFDYVTYRSPYTPSTPISGNPRLQIDAKTGVITGTPNLQGRFVVAVCCNEWRKGKIINTVTREFQFVVTNCSKGVIADMPQFSTEFNTYIVNCKDYTVSFVNTSTGGSTYHWDFGVSGTSADTSSDFMPTYTFPDSGVYHVTLYVNKGTTCADSIMRLVKIYPRLAADFSAPSLVCPGDSVQFVNQTSSTYPISDWQWNFDDFKPIDTNKNPTHLFSYGGLYNVGLIVHNVVGCVDTVFKKIIVDPYRPYLGMDTTIVKGERIYFKGFPGNAYNWTPTKYLSDPTISNPIGYFTDTGTFVYIVSAGSPQTNCFGSDTIVIRVIDNGYCVLPNAFTPNGDGINDKFHPMLVGFQKLRYFRVFNRYGEQMFSTDNIADGWDGTFNGKPQLMGVYYWMLGVTDRFGKDIDQKGDVTLIR